MILEGNPFDLNNLPGDYFRDESREKKSGVKDGKDECGKKVYKCRFCSYKFCKSQALGGHMNRHRQERETETLNHARQLVFRSHHKLPAEASPHRGCCRPKVGGSYDPAGGNIGDRTMPTRFPSYLCGCSFYTHINPQPYLYASTSGPVYFPVNDHYYTGPVLSSTQLQYGHHSLN